MPLIDEINPKGSCFKNLRFDESSDLTNLLECLDLESSENAEGSENEHAAVPVSPQYGGTANSVFGSIEPLKSLTELRLWDGRFLASDIAHALVSPHLEVLDMGKVMVFGCQAHFQTLEKALYKSSIELFILVDFQIMDRAVTLDGIVKALGSLPTIKKVKIEAKKYSRIAFEGASLEGLSKSKTLQELHFSCMDISVAHIFHVAAAIIKSDGNLRVLCLNRVSMDDTSASAIAQAIAGGNCVLEILDLSSNEIGDDGCVALAEGLKSNSSIKSMQLYGNKNIRSKGMAALAMMLEVNHSILRFDAPVSEDRENRVKIEVTLRSKKNDTANTA